MISTEKQTYDYDDTDINPESLFDNAFSRAESFHSNLVGSIESYTGLIIGITFLFILLILATIITFVVVIGVCACNHRCPLYKWRHRREQPPYAVVITDETRGHYMGQAELQLPDSSQVKEEKSIGKHSFTAAIY